MRARAVSWRARFVAHLRLGCALFWAIALASPGIAFAQASPPPGIAMEWLAPDGCPSDAGVRASVAALLGESSAKGNAGALSFRAAVTRAGEKFQLDARIRSASGEEQKTIAGATCGAVADAFALVIAIAVDPDFAGRAPSAPPASVEPAPPAEEPASPPPAAAPGAPWAAGLLAAGSTGALPFPGLGAGVFLAAGERLRWELAALYWFARGEAVGPSRDASVRVDLRAARPSVCLRLSERALVELCSGLEIGWMHAESAGVARDSSGDSWWVAPSVGLAASFPVSRAVRLRVRLDAGVPLLRPTFFVDSAPSGDRLGEWRPAQVLGILGFQPEVVLSATER